jgi:hypothetical protein
MNMAKINWAALCSGSLIGANITILTQLLLFGKINIVAVILGFVAGIGLGALIVKILFKEGK